MWFKRAAHSTRDNWRIDLCRLGHGNPLTVPATNISVVQHPILYGLCQSYNVFRKAFNEIDENYKSAYIFNNPIFKRGIKDDGPLNASFFGGKENPDLRRISYIKYSDCWDHNDFVSRDDLKQQFFCNLSESCFFRLRAALSLHKLENKRAGDLGGRLNLCPPLTSNSISSFFGSFKKGSLHCRKILSKKVNLNLEGWKW